jgi:hypothetical protein
MPQKEMHPALIAAIAAAETAYAYCERQGCSDQEAYDHAWDHAFKEAMAQGLERDDAKVVATSAASDGNADPEEGYKDIIPPYIRNRKMIVNRTDYRKNHKKRGT